jgi:transposase-like protein
MNRKKPGTTRRQFSAEDQANILRRHLADKVPVSDLCDEYGIHPSLFYVWQNQAFGNLSAVLQDGRTRRGEEHADRQQRERIAALEARLARKDAVIAEVSEEYLALKKKLGES